MRARDNLRSRDSTSPALPEMNNEITRITNEHKYKSGDNMCLWRRWIIRQPLQNCGGPSRQYMVNRRPRMRKRQVSSLMQIANYFNRQFTTLKLGRHTSSRVTRLVSREIKRKSFTSAVTFTTDQVTTSIFHLKHPEDPEESNTSQHSSTTLACTWWNRPAEDLSSGKSESTHQSRTVVKDLWRNPVKSIRAFSYLDNGNLD